MGKETVPSEKDATFTVCKDCGRVLMGDWSTRNTCSNCGYEGEGPHYAKEPWYVRFKMKIRVMDESE